MIFSAAFTASTLPTACLPCSGCFPGLEVGHPQAHLGLYGSQRHCQVIPSSACVFGNHIISSAQQSCLAAFSARCGAFPLACVSHALVRCATCSWRPWNSRITQPPAYPSVTPMLRPVATGSRAPCTTASPTLWMLTWRQSACHSYQSSRHQRRSKSIQTRHRRWWVGQAVRDVGGTVGECVRDFLGVRGGLSVCVWACQGVWGALSGDVGQTAKGRGAGGQVVWRRLLGIVGQAVRK